MIFLVVLVIWFLGYSIVSFLGKDFNLAIKIGFSMLIGLGLQSVFMLVFDLVHIPISLLSLLSTSFLISVGLSFKNLGTYKHDLKEVRSLELGFGQINLIWLFFFGIIVYLIYGISVKGIFWPVTEYDAVTGYDFMGKLIAKEKVLRISVFDYSTEAMVVPRFIYPPLVAGSFALQHMCGEMSPKIMPVLFLISLLFSFYGCVRYFTTGTAAIIATAFLAITPEMFAHASLALTNLPNAAYASMAILSFFIWTQRKEQSWLYLAAIVMALTLFSRSDSIVFSMAVMDWLTYYSIKNKDYKTIFIYGAIANSLFIAWTLYLRMFLGSNSSDLFEKSLFWDPDKLDKILTYVGQFIVWDTQLYGIGFWMLYFFLLLNLAMHLFKIKKWNNDLSVFVFVSLASWVLYTFLYYQMNYIVTTMDNFMTASYKRGMFCFVPLAWFYVISNKSSVWLFQKLDGFLYK